MPPRQHLMQQYAAANEKRLLEAKTVSAAMTTLSSFAGRKKNESNEVPLLSPGDSPPTSNIVVADGVEKGETLRAGLVEPDRVTVGLVELDFVGDGVGGYSPGTIAT